MVGGKQVFKALEAMASADRLTAFHDRAAALVLEMVLCGIGPDQSSHNDKVSTAALRAAASLGHPLLDGKRPITAKPSFSVTSLLGTQEILPCMLDCKLVIWIVRLNVK